MPYHTTDLLGVTEINPPPSLMREILESLETDVDAEHPEVWINHLESGWCLTAFPGGTLILDNTVRPAESRRLSGLSSEECLRLWLLLAEGHLAALLNQPWQTLDE